TGQTGERVAMSVVPFVNPGTEARPVAALVAPPASALERVLMHAAEQLGKASSLAIVRVALPDDARQVETAHLPSVLTHLGLIGTETMLARADLDTMGLPVIVLGNDGSAVVVTEVVDS